MGSSAFEIKASLLIKVQYRMMPQHASLLPGGVISRPENTDVLLSTDLSVGNDHPEVQ